MEKLFWVPIAVAIILLLWWVYRVRYARVLKSVLAEYYRREDEGDEDFYVYLAGPFPALTRVSPDERSSIMEGVFLDSTTMRWVKTAKMSGLAYDRLTA